MSYIDNVSPEVAAALNGERKRQREGLELIPSENYVSEAVLEALGSEFTNKYSEGYPGKRYYGGQEYTDMVENLAIKYAKELFGAEYVNVQPLSGSPANLAAYMAMVEPGETILGLDLGHGGHLTHGHKLTVPAKLFKFAHYKTVIVNGKQEIDYDELLKIAKEVKPKLIIAGFSAFTNDLDWSRFKNIADQVGAYTLADIAHISGLIAAGLKENPLVHGFDMVTTTTHKTLRGPRGGMIMTNNEELHKKVQKLVFPGLQGGPHMNNIAAKAVAFKEALHPDFRTYQEQVLKNAVAMTEVFKARKLKMIGGGTTNHLILLDVWNDGQGVTGKDMENALEFVGLTVNKNMIPDDPLSALDPSGIRIGTPAITTRGFTEHECKKVAHIICDVYEVLTTKQGTWRNTLHASRLEVLELTKSFPVQTW